MNTEEFIAKAKTVHGDKYDYSKVGYVNTNTKVCIICSEHGEFWQTPHVHLRGGKCPKCATIEAHNKQKKNINEFIAKANEVHGGKYDYSKVEYNHAHIKVCIICPEHGEFWQTPANHLKGQGCPKCGKKLIWNKRGKTTTEEFIAKANEVHGGKYDYSKVNYVNPNTKVCIICPEHGEFWQTPYEHLKGQGCRKCSFPNYCLNFNEFILKAKKIHGNKYDYSKVNYVNLKTKICIICPEHGEFWQTAGNHLRGRGCPKCSKTHKDTKNSFIVKAYKIHGDKYDYSKVEYVNTRTKVCIICPEHGEFWQTPSMHLRGQGCPKCNRGFAKEFKFNLLEEFESEYAFRAFLENNDINILQVILRNIEPKYEPIKDDLIKALNSSDIDPIHALEEKYKSEEDEDETLIEQTTDISEVIDLDDIDAVSKMIDRTVKTEEQREITIEDVIKNQEQELKVINSVEHMLTPEDREYIMEKFFNDKLRGWMATL